MKIKFVGNSDGDIKVVFEKLLAKWDDLFTRKTLFDGMELVETEGVEFVTTFSNGDTKLTFWQMDSYKDVPMYLKKEHDILIKSKDTMNFYRNILEDNGKNITGILYEVDAKKRILFMYIESTDSSDAILHIKFNDYSNRIELEANAFAVSKGDEVTLNALLKALDKEEIYVHLDNFASQIEKCKKELQDKIKAESEKEKAEREKEKLEKLKPAFDALDTL